MSEKINLYLDDLRDCPDGFILVKNVDRAKYYLENYEIAILSLDHDLGEDEIGNPLQTGYDLVKYLCERGLRADKIYLHTDNPVGRENMYFTLIGAQKRDIISKDILIYQYPYVANKYSKK